MSRHPERQELARFYGATDIVDERGDEGVARIKELTNGLGAHSVIEAVGTQESMMQAMRATRPGGHVGFVGVSHGVTIDGGELFFSEVHLLGGPAPVRRFLPQLKPSFTLWIESLRASSCTHLTSKSHLSQSGGSYLFMGLGERE